MRVDIIFYLVVGAIFIFNKTVMEDIRERKRDETKIEVCEKFDREMWSVDDLINNEKFLQVLSIHDNNVLLAMDADRGLAKLEDIHIRERDRNLIVKECIGSMDRLIRIRSYF